MHGGPRVTGNPELIDQYRQIHASRVYGDTSVKNLRFVRADIKLLRPRSVLDYGCGQSRLLDQLGLGYPVKLIRYDPAIPQYATKPAQPADLLINVDVLEHVEERDLDAVLADMASLCRHAMVIIDTKPASAVLPDGRNAHVTVRPHAWWRERLLRHFPQLYPLATARNSRAGFKTWQRTAPQSIAYVGQRGADNLRHYAGWLIAKLGSR
jgi:2-polyprenyl-3-methyl-5-hydroxy-6-metoxy-1,4-benzoquinol methylase